MSSIDGFCKHGITSRNCYSCHSEKTELDTLHETISELKIRVSKLEEYKRLQDDLNKGYQYFLENNHDLYIILDNYRKKQIDENRAVSKHLTQLDNDNAELNSRQNDQDIETESLHVMLHGWRRSIDNNLGSAHEKIMKLEEFKVRMEILFGDGTPPMDGMRPYPYVHSSLKETLCMDKFTKPKVCAGQDGELGPLIFPGKLKTTGLTFEEALVALKSFKKIKRKHRRYIDHCEVLDLKIKPADLQVFVFPLEDLFSSDWEILE